MSDICQTSMPMISFTSKLDIGDFKWQNQKCEFLKLISLDGAPAAKLSQ